MVEVALASGAPLALTYGLTEAASQVATMPPAGVRAKPGSVGKPLMFTRLRIMGEDGRERPAGEPGEVVVSGPSVMAGYLGERAGTATALREGELYTGDIGYLDTDGDLWLLQRRADLIISGGENVYPAEVEAALRRCPGVVDACVVGLPDEEWGQLAAAVVVLEPGVALTTEDLEDHCRRELAGYKRPRRLQLAAELPLTASGKPAREEVRRLLLDSAA
jgi:O-succinylbenzoic acid--CoA ligase